MSFWSPWHYFVAGSGALALSLSLGTAQASETRADARQEQVYAAAQQWVQAYTQTLPLQDVQAQFQLAPVKQAISASTHPVECPTPTVTPAPGTRLPRLNFHVRCEGQKTVLYAVHVQLKAQVLTAARPIAAGQVLTDDDLVLTPTRLTRASEISKLTSRTEDVRGRLTRRALNAGQVIVTTQLHQPQLIQRWQEVLIVSRVGNAEIRMTGQALQDGSAGTLIKVRNTSSGKTITGRVVDEQTVEVIHNPPAGKHAP